MAVPIAAPWLYNSPSDSALKLNYVGQHLKDCPAPAAVLDIAPIRRNCTAMLKCTEALEVKFRAHVKTHKVCKRGDTKRPIIVADINDRRHNSHASKWERIPRM